jgi:hypothetical protein
MKPIPLNKAEQPATNVFFSTNGLFFRLEPTALQIENTQTKAIISIDYAEIQTLRLDFVETTLRHRSRNDIECLKQYHCVINETWKIRGIKLSDRYLPKRDSKYTDFIKNLHAKTALFPNPNRIYTTNIAKSDFNKILFLMIAFWCTIILSSLFKPEWFFPIHSFTFFGGFSLITCAVILWWYSPSTYSPDYLPDDFLS